MILNQIETNDTFGTNWTNTSGEYNSCDNANVNVNANANASLNLNVKENKNKSKIATNQTLNQKLLEEHQLSQQPHLRNVYIPKGDIFETGDVERTSIGPPI